eukprot:8799503-Alexandrium_andersonii.AAC.1
MRRMPTGARRRSRLGGRALPRCCVTWRTMPLWSSWPRTPMPRWAPFKMIGLVAVAPSPKMCAPNTSASSWATRA